MNECFVIMPISTPKQMVDRYGGDPNHFTHVYEHLFKPAIEKADLAPIPPTVEGADIIQGKIIKRIEEAHLVLCDMSILNPNVFFELGIRTALNKPVCMVKDDATPKVPFDTGIINYHEYSSGLQPWDIESEITKLTDHIKKSVETSNGGNSMWNIFGISTVAQAAEGSGGMEPKLDYLIKQVDAMRSENREVNQPEDQFTSATTKSEVIFDILRSLAKQDGVAVLGMLHSSNSNVIEINRMEGSLSPRTTGQMQRAARGFGRRLVFKLSDETF